MKSSIGSISFQTVSSRIARSGELLGSGELVGIIERLANRFMFGGLTLNLVGIEIARFDVDTTDDRLDETPNENRLTGGRNSPSISSSSSNSDYR